MLGQETLLISEFSLIQQKSCLLFMCYFFESGQFASPPSEPATERAIHTFACKTLWRLSPAVQILFLRCPWNTDSTPLPTVTVGPLRGQNNAVRGLWMGKITWKYEEIIFDNQRNQTKKIQFLGPALTKRLSYFIHMYVQQFSSN